MAIGGITQVIVTLSAMLIMPLLFHAVPSWGSVPPGAVWLPIFYAPLAAVLFFRPHTAAIAAVLSPTINRLLTGQPAPEAAYLLTAELILFVFLTQLILRWRKDFIPAGVVSYLLAKLLVMLLTASHPLAAWGAGFIHSWPGLIILFLIPVMALRKNRFQ